MARLQLEATTLRTQGPFCKSQTTCPIQLGKSLLYQSHPLPKRLPTRSRENPKTNVKRRYLECRNTKRMTTPASPHPGISKTCLPSNCFSQEGVQGCATTGRRRKQKNGRQRRTRKRKQVRHPSQSRTRHRPLSDPTISFSHSAGRRSQLSSLARRRELSF